LKHIFRFFWAIGSLVLFVASPLNAQSEFKYSYVPKKVYENQIFPVTVMATGKENGDTLTFSFDPNGAMQPLFKTPLNIKNGNDNFYTFYFKALKNEIHIPKLFIDSGTHQSSLAEQKILLAKLQGRKDFSGVLAADMKIKNNQVSNYDETHHLVTLSIEAYEANLEDMQLKDVVEYGIEDIERNQAKAEAEFYVVMPVSQKMLTFTYFNTIKQQYVSFEIPIELADTSVSTQSDLNPQEDSFEQLKKYILFFLVSFFLLMFIIKRDFFYLVFGAVSLITLLTFYMPHKKICVKQGASLYILPTPNSTISTKTNSRLETMLLGERGEFKKIEYQKGIIGWIKNEDLCEN